MQRPAHTANGLGFFKTSSTEGSFWTSPESVKALHSFLRDFTPEAGFKQANIGGDQESGFEQAFSSLAFAYLKDRAPRLLDYIIGFQLVDRNEDNTKAVGIFGFKVGKTWLYAPVFFLNGDLKGNELLYIKNQDAFVPCKENWVNYILARRPHTLGEGSDQDVFQLGGMSPNLSRMSGVGGGGRGKFGSDGQIGGRDVDAWARDFYPMFASASTKQARFLFREVPGGKALDFDKIASAPLTPAFVGASAVPDLTEFISYHPSLLKFAHRLYKTYPGIKVAFDRFYGGEEYFLNTAKTMATKFAGDVMTRMADSAGMLTESQLHAMAAKLRPQVFKSVEASIKIAAVLDDAEKSRLMTDGYVIRDKRADDNKTTAYEVVSKTVFTNPTETGPADVLVKPGTFKKMVVFVNPYSDRGPSSLMVAIPTDGEKKVPVIALPTMLYTAGNPMRSDFDEWFDKLGGSEMPTSGGNYIAVGKNGQSTLPFHVAEVYGGGRFRVNFQDRTDRDSEFAKARLPNNVRNSRTTSAAWRAFMTVGVRKGGGIHTVDGQTHIPDGFKFIKVSDGRSSNYEENDNNVAPGLGSPLDLQTLMAEKTARLKIWSDGVDVTMLSKLGNDTYSSRGALFALVQDHGLDEQAAKSLLKQAAASTDAVAVNLKYAAGFPYLGAGPDAPAMPPPEVGSEQVGYGSVPSQYFQEEHVDVPGSDASKTDPSVYDPFLTPDKGAIGIAEQAGQSGQKEVFDASMISGMLKSVTQDSMIDRYLGPLMKALDKLGRLMFMFYWHQEEFQDRFGKAEMPDLEDALRNTFEALGDTLLTLKEKTIDAGLDEIGDPDISNVARN